MIIIGRWSVSYPPCRDTAHCSFFAACSHAVFFFCFLVARFGSRVGTIELLLTLLQPNPIHRTDGMLYNLRCLLIIGCPRQVERRSFIFCGERVHSRNHGSHRARDFTNRDSRPPRSSIWRGRGGRKERSHASRHRCALHGGEVL